MDTRHSDLSLTIYAPNTALIPLCYLFIFTLFFTGCAPLDETLDHLEREEIELSTHTFPLNAYCDAAVVGRGNIDVESDYLPRVVMCENGAAGFEALKAQAVAARSYLYYKLENYGEIEDGQSDQVFGCGREPQAQHYAAVEATSGEVLTYTEDVIAAFYVAGAIPSTMSCIPNDSDPDRTNTERYVTYNEGKSGDDLNQTSLGWVNPANTHNRGCHSQNGANCLSNQGWSYDDILRFYYGEDIIIERSVGECILPNDPQTGGQMGGPGGGAEGGAQSGATEAGVQGGAMGGGVQSGAMEGGVLNEEVNREVVLEWSDEHTPPSDPDANPNDYFLPAGVIPTCTLTEELEIFDVDAQCAWKVCQAGLWERVNEGYRVEMSPEGGCTGGWMINIQSDGEYELSLLIPDWIEDEQSLRYQVMRSNTTARATAHALIPLSANQDQSLGRLMLNTDDLMTLSLSNRGEQGWTPLTSISLRRVTDTDTLAGHSGADETRGDQEEDIESLGAMEESSQGEGREGEGGDEIFSIEGSNQRPTGMSTGCHSLHQIQTPLFTLILFLFFFSINLHIQERRVESVYTKIELS